jgi:hypothetical protein
MTRKTIRLVVTMPDPGEWCSTPDGASEWHECPRLYNSRCDIGHAVPADSRWLGLRRPQSCRDAEFTAEECTAEECTAEVIP